MTTTITPQAITEFQAFLDSQQEGIEIRLSTPLYQVLGMNPETVIKHVFNILKAELRVMYEDRAYEEGSLRYDERRETAPTELEGRLE